MTKLKVKGQTSENFLKSVSFFIPEMAMSGNFHKN